MFPRTPGLCLSALFLLLAEPSMADLVRVGVASNFAGPARELASRYESATGHQVQLSTASTGKLYAQLIAGAPFDVFLAADELRPARLTEAGVATENRVYALGRLAVVSADPDLAGADCEKAFLDTPSATVAIANPATAPYGKTAQRWLDATAGGARRRVVTGDNVGQAMSFVVSGNARFGVVAVAQLEPVRAGWPGCMGELPADSYQPVRQAAAITSGAGPAATGFYEFLFTTEARAMMQRWGYDPAVD